MNFWLLCHTSSYPASHFCLCISLIKRETSAVFWGNIKVRKALKTGYCLFRTGHREINRETMIVLLPQATVGQHLLC